VVKEANEFAGEALSPAADFTVLRNLSSSRSLGVYCLQYYPVSSLVKTEEREAVKRWIDPHRHRPVITPSSFAISPVVVFSF